jgi:hypothetical protein
VITDFNARMLRSLAAGYPSSSWDVLPGVDAPEMPVCATYGSVLAAAAALEAAGFKACRHPVPAPGLDGRYDLMTMLRLSAGDGRDVVLVRRLP